VKPNPLETLGTLGRSLWLDYIRRDLIGSGKLRRRIENVEKFNQPFDELMETLEKASPQPVKRE
jgi:hypothetical protein